LAFFRIMGARRLYRSAYLERFLSRLPGGSRVHGIIGCFNLLREQPATFFQVIALSISNHICWCAALLFITTAFDQEIGIVQGFTVFPIAIFGNTFGFAGGFGVGTAAFDLVFSNILQIHVGAAIGLAFQILSALTRLTGLPFYLQSSAGSSK